MLFYSLLPKMKANGKGLFVVFYLLPFLLSSSSFFFVNTVDPSTGSDKKNETCGFCYSVLLSMSFEKNLKSVKNKNANVNKA